jgi:hypothetical protein
MEYYDEKIVAARHIKRRDEYGDIESGLYIKDELIKFEKKLICRGKLEVMLPENFVPMLPEIAEIKYMSGERPEEIYMSIDTSVNFTFNYIQDLEPESDMRLAVGFIKHIIKSYHSDYVFYSESEEVEKDVIINWFDFKSFGIDDPAYNIMYLANIENKLLQGTFSCLYNEKDEWKRVALEVIKSVKRYEKEV